METFQHQHSSELALSALVDGGWCSEVFCLVAVGRWRGALVAVKVVAHDCSIASLAETLRESALSTSIQHPNVVRHGNSVLNGI